MRTYTELTLEEKIVQVRLMRRNRIPTVEIGAMLHLNHNVIKTIIHPAYNLTTASELATILRDKGYV